MSTPRIPRGRALALAALLTPPVAAEEDWTLSPEIQVRPRLEVHSGRDGAAGGEQHLVRQRARFGASLQQDDLLLRAVVQDARLWGEEPATNSMGAEGLDLRIAHFTWAMTPSWSLTVGRQERALHEQRLLAVAGWPPQGQVFDGVHSAFEGERLQGEAFAAMMGEADSETWEGDRWLGLLRVGPSLDSATLDWASLLETDAAVDRQRLTTGLYWKSGGERLGYRLEGFAQLGREQGEPIQAWMASAKVDSQAGPWGFSAASDVLSGDETPDEGPWTAFTIAHGARHKFWGHLDVMVFNEAASVDGLGLMDNHLTVSRSLGDQSSLSLIGHHFSSAPPHSPESLAQELDILFKRSLRPGLDLAAELCGMRYADGRSPDGLFWLQLDARLP